MAEAKREVTVTQLETDSLARTPLRPVPPAANARPLDVSIAIVTWNSERWIDGCLAAIPAACEGLAYEIVVYDNASSDTTLQRIAGDDQSGDKSIIRSQQNDGFAAGVNRALAVSKGRYAFLLNPDCELEPGALTALLTFLDAHPAVAAAAPLLTGENGHEQREFQLRELPTFSSLALEVLLHRKTSHYRDMDLTEPQRIEQPAAAALLIRRQAFDEVGPLDEQFSPAWFEDVDYCQRLARAGKAIFVVPAARARHFVGASLEHLSFGAFIDIWYRNMWLYARKWLSPSKAEGVRWVIMLGMMMRCVAATIGLAHPEAGRGQALRAYRAVLEKAFNRWDESSRSSS